MIVLRIFPKSIPKFLLHQVRTLSEATHSDLRMDCGACICNVLEDMNLAGPKLQQISISLGIFLSGGEWFDDFSGCLLWSFKHFPL